MKIEMNLVRNQGIYSPVFTLVARNRVDITEGMNVLDSVAAFIQTQNPIIDATLADKDLVARLATVEHLTMSEFYSVKYLLAQAGLDLLVNTVADLEVNEEEIEGSSLEYNIIDNNTVGFPSTMTKIVMPNDQNNLFALYSRIQEIYGFFDEGVLAGINNNPLVRLINAMKITEETMGVVPSTMTTEMNSILEYLGKRIILITNE